MAMVAIRMMVPLFAFALVTACAPSDRTRVDSVNVSAGGTVDSSLARGTTIDSGTTGDTAMNRSLLQASTWKVRDIDHVTAADTMRATIKFGTDGKVTGNSTCNTYSGSYTLNGSQIQVQQVVSTKR